MFMQNINRRVGMGNGLYHYICTEKCHGMFVYWAKVVVFAILSDLYPQYNLICVDSDAVITEELFQKVVFDKVSRPAIVNTSDLGGLHNAGYYMLYRHVLQPSNSVEKLPDKHECTAKVMNKYTGYKLKFTTCESHPLILNEQTSIFEQCIQSMMTCFWGSTTLDCVRIESIDESFIVWLCALGKYGQSHWQNDVKRPFPITNHPLEQPTMIWAGSIHEQGAFTVVRRLAEIQGFGHLVSTFSGNEGCMVGDMMSSFFFRHHNEYRYHVELCEGRDFYRAGSSG